MTTPIEQLSFKPTGATVAKSLGDHTAEIVNVKDYGALGNGGTDDTAAIQKALNAAYGMAQFTGSISGTTLTATSVVGTIAVGMTLSAKTGIAVNLTPTITADLGGGQYSLSGSSLGTITSRPMMACVNQGSYARKKVFIPAGNYIVQSPLYILGVLGAHVYGAGNGATQIYFQTGSPSQGNVVNDAGFSGNSDYTPVWCLDGVAYSKFEMFDVGTSIANAETDKFVAFMFYQSGATGTTSAIMLENINIGNFWTGVVGVQGSGNVENCILTNVSFDHCALNGVYLTNQNVLNWQIYGGGASGCSWLSSFVLGAGTGTVGAAYNSGVGSIGCIYGVSCTGNKIDIYNGGQQMHVAGGSFEGASTFNGTLTWSGGTATITTTFPHMMTGTSAIVIYGATTHTGYNGRYTGTVTGANTVTYSISDPGGSDSGTLVSGDACCIACAGSTMSVDGIAYRPGDTGYALAFYNQGGLITVNGSFISPAHDGGFGTIAWLSNGVLQLNGTIFEAFTNSSFKSAGGGSELYLHGSIWIGTPTAPFAQFSGGFVRDYDQIYTTTVSALPTAAAIFTGLRGVVTDLNISRSFGGSVVTHGSGSTVCPVVCTGSDWIMG